MWLSLLRNLIQLCRGSNHASDLSDIAMMRISGNMLGGNKAWHLSWSLNHSSIKIKFIHQVFLLSDLKWWGNGNGNLYITYIYIYIYICIIYIYIYIIHIYIERERSKSFFEYFFGNLALLLSKLRLRQRPEVSGIKVLRVASFK